MNNIKFCKKCGGILDPVAEGEKIIGKCKCGNIDENFSLEFLQKSENDKKGDGIAHDVETLGFPHKCKKCGHEECDITDLGAPYSDESNIYLYKCKKCKHTERQADGSGNK